jgi:hypothetical protein
MYNTECSKNIYIREVGADVKTEKSVIQDGTKSDVSAVKNDIQDKIENSISAVCAGQEELKSDTQTVGRRTTTETQQEFAASVGIPADFVQRGLARIPRRSSGPRSEAAPSYGRRNVAE